MTEKSSYSSEPDPRERARKLMAEKGYTPVNKAAEDAAIDRIIELEDADATKNAQIKQIVEALAASPFQKKPLDPEELEAAIVKKIAEIKAFHAGDTWSDEDIEGVVGQ